VEWWTAQEKVGKGERSLAEIGKSCVLSRFGYPSHMPTDEAGHVQMSDE